MFALMRPSLKQRSADGVPEPSARVKRSRQKRGIKGKEVKKARSLSMPVGADEGKADRPLSRAVAALRPWRGGFSTTRDTIVFRLRFLTTVHAVFMVNPNDWPHRPLTSRRRPRRHPHVAERITRLRVRRLHHREE